MRLDFTVRDTMIRAIAASKQHKPINAALIANAVFISMKLFTVDIILFFVCFFYVCVFGDSFFIVFCLIFRKRDREITKWIGTNLKLYKTVIGTDTTLGKLCEYRATKPKVLSG